MKRILLSVMFVFAMCSATAFGYESADMASGGYLPVDARVAEDMDFHGGKDTPDESVCLLNAADGTAAVEAGEYYGYGVLSAEDERLASAYERIMTGMANQANEVDVSEFTLTADELKKIFCACTNDCPQLFYVYVNGYSYSVPSPYVRYFYPQYISGAVSAECVESFEAAADMIIQSSGARADMSDYDKALMLHNELALQVDYNSEALEAINEANAMEQSEEKDTLLAELNERYPNIHSAYGALVDKNAVCDGYSRAYQYLLYKMGIVSHIATGTGNGGAHAWNAVKLDGKWYYTDLTWDDSAEHGIFYAYFNMTDEQLADANHILDNSYAMPVCNSTELNYFVKNGGTMTTGGDLENVTQQLKKNSYARVYVTGDKSSVGDIWTWYAAQARNIAQELGLSRYSYGAVAAGREFHLFMYHGAACPLKNMALEITGASDGVCDVFAVFYDENSLIKCVNRINDVTIKAKGVTVVNCTEVPDSFNEVKYFVWDSFGGMIPLYKYESVKY